MVKLFVDRAFAAATVAEKWVLASVACAVTSAGFAGECSTATAELYADEESDVILCGELLSADTQVSVGMIATLLHVQPLQRCGINDKRPGLHIVLRGTQPGQTTVRVADSAGTPVCAAQLTVSPVRAQAEPAWLNAMPLSEARYVDVNGIRTRYFDKGTGPVMVLVHGGQAGGANNSAQKWEQNFYSLTHTHRVIALDRLAQAGTDNLPTAEAYADYFARDAEHLEAFIDTLQLRDVVLVGHSQGGWPVTRVALNRPDLIRCLVNVDTVMVPDDMDLMREALAFLMYTSRYADPASGPTVYSARRSMALRYPTGRNITRAKAQRVVDQYQLPKTAAAREAMASHRITPLHPSFKALKAAAYADINAGKLSTRSVVIWGELDPQVPLGLGQQFNAMLQDAGVDSRLAIVPGTGHAPFIEEPERFNALVAEQCGTAPDAATP